MWALWSQAAVRNEIVMSAPFVQLGTSKIESILKCAEALVAQQALPGSFAEKHVMWQWGASRNKVQLASLHLNDGLILQANLGSAATPSHRSQDFAATQSHTQLRTLF